MPRQYQQIKRRRETSIEDIIYAIKLVLEHDKKYIEVQYLTGHNEKTIREWVAHYKAEGLAWLLRDRKDKETELALEELRLNRLKNEMQLARLVYESLETAHTDGRLKLMNAIEDYKDESITAGDDEGFDDSLHAESA